MAAFSPRSIGYMAEPLLVSGLPQLSFDARAALASSLGRALISCLASFPQRCHVMLQSYMHCNGGSRTAKPSIFACKASAGNERYLVCTPVAVWIVSGSFSIFCND